MAVSCGQKNATRPAATPITPTSASGQLNCPSLRMLNAAIRANAPSTSA